MKPRHIALGLAGLAVASLWLWGEPPGHPSPDLALPLPPEARRAAAPLAPAPAPAPTFGQAVSAARPALEAAPATLYPRAQLLAEWRQGQRPDRLFAPTTWAAPPAPPVRPVALAPAAPVAPPLPFKYIGRQTQGGQQEAFLADGAQVHVVRPGSVIAGRWRVDSLGTQALTLTYLPLNQTQQLLTRATE